jgi:hypothetical protein
LCANRLLDLAARASAARDKHQGQGDAGGTSGRRTAELGLGEVIELVGKLVGRREGRAPEGAEVVQVLVVPERVLAGCRYFLSLFLSIKIEQFSRLLLSLEI